MIWEEKRMWISILIDRLSVRASIFRYMKKSKTFPCNAGEKSAIGGGFAALPDFSIDLRPAWAAVKAQHGLATGRTKYSGRPG